MLLVSMFNGAVRVALLEHAPYLATQSLERSNCHRPSSAALTTGFEEFAGFVGLFVVIF
jgi:hypothetical protein